MANLTDQIKQAFNALGMGFWFRRFFNKQIEAEERAQR